MCMQCPHINPIKRVPIRPKPHPELENAKGPANNPDPKEAFIKFAVALISLK